MGSIHEKNRGRKSRDTAPLNHLIYEHVQCREPKKVPILKKTITLCNYAFNSPFAGKMHCAKFGKHKIYRISLCRGDFSIKVNSFRVSLTNFCRELHTGYFVHFFIQPQVTLLPHLSNCSSISNFLIKLTVLTPVFIVHTFSPRI